MIVSITKRQGEDTRFTTDGCGCCSNDLYLPQDEGEITDHVKNMASIFIDCCKELDLDPHELINSIQ